MEAYFRKIKLTCNLCHKIYYKSPSSSIKSKFCSNVCKWKYQSKFVRGNNHPHWRGGRINLKCEWCQINIKKTKSDLKNSKHLFCSWACRNRFYNKIRGNKMTDIEMITQKILIKNNINFIPQPDFIKVSLPDFYLPDYKVFLFCDGDYWHKQKDRITSDRKQNKKLKELGYRVLRFWGSDIYKESFESNLKSVL
jgi:G:T-mismatch repair DNA endonuclease (very short patch repair protein)